MNYFQNKILGKRQTSRQKPDKRNQTIRRNPTPYYSANPIMRSASMPIIVDRQRSMPISRQRRSMMPISADQRQRSAEPMPSPVPYTPMRSPEKGVNTTNLFFSKKISTEANTDPHYRMIGMVSFSDTEGINALRTIGTDIANFFGRKGFDMSVFDSLRISTLEKIEKLLEPNQKICSCRMEFDQGATGANIFHHFYGTLFQKK
jgi:hypothetical protein